MSKKSKTQRSSKNHSGLTRKQNATGQRGSFILVMVLGALAPWPVMVRMGFSFDYGTLNPITLAAGGALICGCFAYLGSDAGKGGLFIKLFGTIAAIVIFLLSFALATMPV